jgi:hypothetical protein
VADHPRPAPDVALGHGAVARRGAGERLVDVVHRHVEAVDVVQQAIPGLAGDRQRPERRPERQLADGVADDPVVDDTDAVGVRDPDRPGQQAGLADPLEPGQLAVPVQAVAAGVDRPGEDVALVRQDHRHARPDRALADDEATLAADDRRVADADAGDIRDRVPRTRPSAPDPNPQIPRSNAQRAASALFGTRDVASSPPFATVPPIIAR